MYGYKDEEFDKVVELVDETTPFGLTGAIFINDM